MAKRRTYTKVKAAARRVYSYARRKVRRSYSASKGASMSLIDISFSFGYGFLRGKIAQIPLVQQGMSMIPFGGAYKDNIFLGGAAFVINWLMKPTNHLIKLGLRTIVNHEAFIAGTKASYGASITSSAVAGEITSGDFL